MIYVCIYCVYSKYAIKSTFKLKISQTSYDIMLSFLTTQQCVVTLATLNGAIRFESVPSTESMDIDVGYPTAILEGYDSECMYYICIYLY